MNVEFIPRSGSFGALTAVVELRPDIGDRVAVGEFVLQKEVKVFDFTAFALLADKDRVRAVLHTRYDFISQMEDQISQRILPYEKQLRYIPTQMVQNISENTLIATL